MARILEQLDGADLRTIGNAGRIAVIAQGRPCLLKQLAEGLNHSSAGVRMRSADALEKATRTDPKLLKPFRALLLRLINPMTEKAVLWHVLQMSSRIVWTRAERAKAFAQTKACLSSQSSIVKANALEALLELAESDEAYLKPVQRIVRSKIRTGTPAMKARGKKLLRRLAGLHRAIK